MSVLKKLSAFVPTMEDTIGNLEPAPETPAPRSIAASPVIAAMATPPRPRRRTAMLEDRLRTKAGGVDGRSMRRTGRTAMMSLKVRPELPEAMKASAFEDGITLGELMDEMWSAYQARRRRSGEG